MIDLSREDMRRLGYAAVDLLLEHYATLGEGRVAQKLSRSELQHLAAEPLPSVPADPLDVLEQLRRDVLPYCVRLPHPRFFAFVPGPSNYVSAVADFLASGFDVFSGTWISGAGAAAVELATVDWMKEKCGLPEDAEGLFVSGGSVANLTALAVARRVKLDDDLTAATVYYSGQTHSSVERGLRILGLREHSHRSIEVDEHYRIRIDVLRDAIARDRAAGLRPFCVVANAGTTNTGAIDDIPALLELCRGQDLWLHVDGAYGAAAVFSERGRTLLSGLGDADSLSLDPHKWLFQPFEIGCALVRDGALLKRTFQIMPEYLAVAHRSEEEVNFCDRGIQLTRSFRALKLWMSLKVFGADVFARAIDRGFELAEYAESRVRSMPGWRVVTPAQMAVVTFQYNKRLDANRIVDLMREDGYAFLTPTILRGETVLRLCTINPRTTEADIDGTLERLDRFAAQLTA
jgi:glutamate/tyrosine decarboxylase-like PLP-dependent enzyme